MNIITERHEMAIVMNFGKYPVLGLELNNKDYSKDFIVGSKVRVAWDRKDPKWEGMTSRCELMVENGKYGLYSDGCCLTDRYTVEDFVNDIENASTPLVHRGQIIAVAHYSRENNAKLLKMMRVSERIDTQCMMVASLKELDDEEMQEVRDYIERMKKW